MSIAGGVDQAVIRGRQLGCGAIQIFIKSNVQWSVRPFRPGEKARFKKLFRLSGITVIFTHSSYLINLASPDTTVRKKSLRSLQWETKRTAELGLPYIVIHPGSHGGCGEKIGIRRIISGLDAVFKNIRNREVSILLETTAGQGTSIGRRFEQLADIIAHSKNPERLGVCFDTCHVFAAGYDIRKRSGYEAVMDEFDRLVGLHKIRAFHLNDARGTVGSHLDRHAHIGKGGLGYAPFAMLLNDERFASVPMVLETPKGTGTRLDKRNLRILKDLMGKSRRRTRHSE
jgi:deoxyribonuclease-4